MHPPFLLPPQAAGGHAPQLTPARLSGIPDSNGGLSRRSPVIGMKPMALLVGTETMAKTAPAHPIGPNHGDTIIIHSMSVCGPGLGLLECGVPLRLEALKSKKRYRFTRVDTGSAVDDDAWTLAHCDWSLAA